MTCAAVLAVWLGVARAQSMMWILRFQIAALRCTMQRGKRTSRSSSYLRYIIGDAGDHASSPTNLAYLVIDLHW